MKIGIIASERNEWHVQNLLMSLKNRGVEGYVFPPTHLLSKINSFPRVSVKGFAIEEFATGDFKRPRFMLHGPSQEIIISADVLYHRGVHDDLAALREMARCLKPGRPLFATTVIDSNALDHLHRFAP